ncbi:probable E3 ubiquitin-protein ligase TRIML1 [Monodelphis domestica]|uniref:probable E3 ubiquitin-protein ligase TRIML1 n=1 Tax=Monodelphis domestica TaxID=13616 RepID=UPI0000F2DB2C|nr:probable E3 ubiquitin-protein ligase TRIML1 [Monodelphis domestica]
MAADWEIVQNLQNEITCGICRNYFSQPVTIDCGHSFCRECLSRSWSIRPFSCPECRQVPQIRQFPKINSNLEKLTDISLQLSPLNLQRAIERNQCPIHKKAFKVFCEEDQTSLCVLCFQMPEHRAHTLTPAEEAAQNYREKFREILSHLEKDFEEAKKYLSQEKEMEEGPDWNEMIMAEYCKLHSLLLDEEVQYLERLKEEQRTRKFRLSQHIGTIQEIMIEIQESSYNPNAELLKDIRELLGRGESVLSQRSNVIIPELREYSFPAMIDCLNKFRVDIRVDPKSSSSYVTVSEDQKTMRAEEGWQVDYSHAEDSTHHYVFADQAFSSGSHYWEVDVTQVSQWALGIYSPTLRKENSLFLLSCVKKENNYYFQTYPESLNHQVKDPVPRIGVYLDYSTGILLFYNVLQSSPIYRFYPLLFIKPVIPVFSPGPPLPGTKANLMTICSVNSHLCACCYSCL